MNLRRFFTRRAADADLAQELEAHIQHEVDDNLARGMSKEEAIRRARVKLGSPPPRPRGSLGEELNGVG